MAVEKGYPTVTARTSADENFDPSLEMDKYLKALRYISGKIPFEVFDIIDQMCLSDPYVARYHQSTVSLAHTAHSLSIVAPGKKKAEMAIAVCNELAENCFYYGGGMNGLISACFSQLARTNATCVEAPPNKQFKAVDQLYPVPIKSLRFTFDDEGHYLLCQNQARGIIPLNPAQTIFVNAMMRDGNPYPIPPIIAAIEPAAIHRSIINQVKDWMSKLSALGVMIAEVEPPPRSPGETQEDYDSKARTYLQAIANSVTDNMASGLGIGYNNIKFTFQNTQASASGAKDILQMVLLGLFAGLNRDAALMGWNLRSSDSFVSVIYEEFVQSISFYQLAVKRVVEFVHRLNLALHGLSDCLISCEFAPSRSLNEFMDAEAAYMLSQKAGLELERGIINLDEARLNLGYSKEQTKDGSFIAQFSQEDNKYDITSNKIFSFASDKKKNSYIDELLSMMMYANTKGIDALRNYLKGLRNFSEDSIVNAITYYLNEYEDNVDTVRLSNLANKEIVENWKAVLAGSEISNAELAAIAYLSTIVEPWAVKQFVSRSQDRKLKIKSYFSTEFDKIRNGSDVDSFITEAEKYLSSMVTNSAIHTATTTAQRSQAWASLFNLERAGIERFRIDGPDDERTCGYCRDMIGKEFSVKTEMTSIRDIVDAGEPSSVGDFLTARYSLSELAESTESSIQELGMASPPYHPRCRHYVVPV
jgi:hypothetical protein